ncbi:hypothetical protein HYPSUDRAFT_210308 [Hypholoma sublateritium FD-334 SS-4]|uniref:Uncharacterized protein n=1 Tax=Hypholoma sublateritium (strain FD-334 SS-4) TaxID=945553 RepID=A0A0D2LPB3_HYPSF|nr:hypothetical protein HYPSUDRAFT_210308 [Hypholoma sublateritium FD-334 SS-4]
MLPRFLFPHGHIHNPDDIANDIFRGHVMLRVRFALSSTPSWVVKDGTFSYQDFYHHIVELLEEDDEETSQVIKLYNQ